MWFTQQREKGARITGALKKTLIIEEEVAEKESDFTTSAGYKGLWEKKIIFSNKSVTEQTAASVV